MALDLPMAVPPRERGIFCNRTLNLRAMRAVGYDMDYTLIHYHERLWEELAFAYTVEALAAEGWPTDSMVFDADFAIRGLIIDTELGNIVKANRFGYVKRAAHGTRMLAFGEQKAVYARLFIDLRSPRWRFMNTLFSLSEACLYTQLVERLDRRELPEGLGYQDLYRVVRRTLNAQHMEGRLKQEIMADPARFVDLDPETPLALLDQREAGKKLVLITNSGWGYTQAMMNFAFDPYLPGGMTWQDLFDLKVVSARKPLFFEQGTPMFEVVSEDGLLRPVFGELTDGGNVERVEHHFGFDGTQILYVGDHVHADVHASKSQARWRTALVVRELETEIGALERFGADQRELEATMADKAALELRQAQLKLALQRRTRGYGAGADLDRRALEAELGEVREAMMALDAVAAPLARRNSELANPRWGLPMRAGNDKSHLARQIERHADIYLSRVSNFYHHTPFQYFRSPRSSLPHDG